MTPSVLINCGAPLMKLSYTSCFLFLLLCFFAGCAPQTRVEHDQGPATDIQTTTYQGTIVRKSSRQHTITLKIPGSKPDKETVIQFDYRTKGMEYGVKGKQVKITCKREDDKTCKAVTIEPGGTIYASGVTPITMHQFKKMIDANRDFVLIDTRSAAEYGRCHLPSAISMPACTTNVNSFPQTIDRDETLIFYCGWPDCHRSIRASKHAAQSGFSNIHVLQGGLQAWVDKKYPTVASDEFVQNGGALVLDLRQAGKDRVRRIEGSISLPLPLLADKIGEIPHEAPVVVYGKHLEDSLSALKTLRAAGFSKAAMVEGNFRGWIQRENRVVSGPVQTTISWKRPQQQNEISIAQFIDAEHNKIKAIILDVRTDKELNILGRLTNSVHIPLSSLSRRMDELDKKQRIYCAAGPRAELAGRILRKKGYRAFFLATDLTCDGKKCRAGK